MRMVRIVILSLLLLTITNLGAQDVGLYDISLEELVWEEAPALQSYVYGIHNGLWVFIGGRTDGLHRRQPWASFWEEDNNRNIYVLDPVKKLVYHASIDSLAYPLNEQLASTNMQFSQVGSDLFITGGYAYSPTAEDHITFPYVVKVDLEGLTDAIVSGDNIAGFFSFTEDERMQVTGGNMSELDGWFYLVGGQKFMGRYNPMGPDHGPGFVQEYTEEIRKFQIEDNDGEPLITEYTAWNNKELLHRRDYNLSPQIFEDGERGFILFSGVFQLEEDIPWMNSIKITSEGYEEIPGFEQRFCQYHTAKTEIFDETTNEMHTVFFGGIGRYYIDSEDRLMNDVNVPFVNTISLVTRDSEGQMQEFKIGEMPEGDYLGASAWFLPNGDLIRRINKESPEEIELGYIYGGIESSGDNIFFINDGNQSDATNRIFKVTLEKVPTVSVREQDKNTNLIRSVYPNPTRDTFTVEYETKEWSRNQIWISDSSGRLIRSFTDKMEQAGSHSAQIKVAGLAAGTYHMVLKTTAGIDTEKIIIQ